MDFNNTSGIKSPFSPRVRQSLTGRRPMNITNKKSQSKYMQGNQTGEVVYKTALTTLETYGMPLPVMVTEALTFASGEVSVRLSSCGWCWLVTGRRVLAWPREPPATSAVGSPAPLSAPQARELTLPQSDLAHKADLVVLFYEDGAQMPSCIGVSPEGIVRYWPSIGQEGIYVDVSAELAGQECDRLTEPTQTGSILATTTCSLVVLKNEIVEGRATVSCRPLRPPSGWLGGLGRRVSLLFFGSMPAHPDTKLVGVIVVREGPLLEKDGGCVALVSSGGLLQIWAEDLHEHDLRECLQRSGHGDIGGELSILSVRGHNGGLALLLAASGPRPHEVRYAIAHMSLSDPLKPLVPSLVSVRGAPRVDDGPPRLLTMTNRHIIYTSKYIAVVSGNSADPADVIDLSCEGDRLLGALGGPVPLLFSARHGVLLLITAGDGQPGTTSICDSPMGSPCPSDMYDGNLSFYEIDPNEAYQNQSSLDACGKLKTAFLLHVRRNVASCAAVLRDTFPCAGPHRDAPLDRTVLAVANDMLDDMPAGDPRWKQRQTGITTNVALGSSAALQVSGQLRDKQRAFTLYVDFLKATGLWRRLYCVSTENGGAISTVLLLRCLWERLAAARALIHAPRGPLLDNAVHQVINSTDCEDFEEDPEVLSALSSGALSPWDVVFRRVSQVCRVLAEVGGPPRAPPTAQAQHAVAQCALINSVLSEMLKARGQWESQNRLEGPPPDIEEANCGRDPDMRAVSHVAVQLHRKSLLEYSKNCSDPTIRATLSEEALRMADLLLTEAGEMKDQSAYEMLRHELIQPFVTEGEIERALALAEKFKDFELLISICVKEKDFDKLCAFIDKYIDEGLAEKAFAWLYDNDSSQLIRRLGNQYPARLTNWLGKVQDRHAMLALHHLQRNDCEAAAPVFVELSMQENSSVNRMTILSSLAKLCLAASSSYSPELWRAAEGRLCAADQHHALPRDIRLHHGIGDDCRVHEPDELIDMYVTSDSSSLTEYDYKKALDLTDFVQDMERRDELRLKIWCSVIRRDDWSSCGADGAECGAALSALALSRLAALVCLSGGDLALLLPPADDVLTAPDLADVVGEPKAQYALRRALDEIRQG